MKIRRARMADAVTIHHLVNLYAGRQQMLPRTLLSIYENIRDFQVAVVDHDSIIVGCSALHFTWSDMAEIRSLAVNESTKGAGIGRALVEANIAEAREQGIVQVYAFTYVTGFFSRLGFSVVPHESMPRKVWMDCITCPKFNCCDETAMVLDLVEGVRPEPFDLSQVSIPVAARPVVVRIEGNVSRPATDGSLLNESSEK
ncbi:MAG: N-acetyltransferase [Acidobacteria bacterium]|nr:N-acetyltransferase [Acidobacteriota bacterium]